MNVSQIVQEDNELNNTKIKTMNKISVIFLFVYIALGTCTLLATTSMTKKVTCGCCGADVEVNVVHSNSSFGLPDLDGRPAPPARYLYLEVLQYCGKCGYCALDVTQKPRKQKSQDYIRKIKPKVHLAIKNKNLAYLYHVAASITLLENEITDDGWKLELNAAWFCDDVHDEGQAVEYRKRTIRYVTKQLEKKEDYRLLLLKCDLLRRIGQFQEALDIALKLEKERGFQEHFQKYVRSEIDLIKNKNDYNCKLIK